MTLEKPTSFDLAQSKIAVHKAPDCEIKAILPAIALPLLKVAFSPISGRITPRQLGPISRISYCCAFSSTSCSKALPASPASPKPAVIITAALT